MSPSQIEQSMRASGLGSAAALGLPKQAIIRAQTQSNPTLEYNEDGFVVYNSKTLQHRKMATKGLLQL